MAIQLEPGTKVEFMVPGGKVVIDCHDDGTFVEVITDTSQDLRVETLEATANFSLTNQSAAEKEAEMAALMEETTHQGSLAEAESLWEQQVNQS